jgi:hypothetical protein
MTINLPELEQAYLSYKERFFKHFITLSDDVTIRGTNLPASGRYVWGGEGINYGDTTIEISYYLIFLSTDYYLNKNPETLKQLKNALLSLNRLDLLSKREFDSKQPLYLNGFFMRDDLRGSIFYEYCKNQLEPETFNGKVTINRPITYLIDDKDSYNDINGLNRAIERNVMSQDQFWHLFLGFSVINKLINDEEILAMMHNIIDRFLKYSLKTCNQVIKNPVTGKKVPRGADIRLFAYGFAKAGDLITEYDNKYRKMLHWWNKPLYKIGVFGAEFLYNMTRNIWKLPLKEYSYRSLGCIGDIWWNKKYIKHLIKDFERKDWYPHFVLIHKILHDSNIEEFNKEKLERILSSIPKDGSLWKFDNTPIHYIWSVDSYLYNPEYSKFDNNKLESFNGLDFMCLYNLYKIVYNPKNIK